VCTVDKRVRRIFIFNKVCTDNVFRFMPSGLTATASFLRVFFRLLQCSKQHPSFSAHRAALMTKTAWFVQQFLYDLCILQFISALLVSFHNFHKKLFESSLTVAWFSWTNHNSFLHIATNEIASFYVGNRLHQMAVFTFGWP